MYPGWNFSDPSCPSPGCRRSRIQPPMLQLSLLTPPFLRVVIFRICKATPRPLVRPSFRSAILISLFKSSLLPLIIMPLTWLPLLIVHPARPNRIKSTIAELILPLAMPYRIILMIVLSRSLTLRLGLLSQTVLGPSQDIASAAHEQSAFQQLIPCCFVPDGPCSRFGTVVCSTQQRSDIERSGGPSRNARQPDTAGMEHPDQ